jgi:hypothetical protein
MAAHAAGVGIRDFWSMTFWEFGAVMAARIESIPAPQARSADDLFAEMSRHAVGAT